MLKTLFVCGVLGVLLIPVKSSPIEVCLEDDKLRVDCRVEPQPNKYNTYEFSWSSGSQETVIYTNVSGSKADQRFKGKSSVVELEPHGYRMTLTGFTDYNTTTYMCKISGKPASVVVEKDKLEKCSAPCMFLKSSWSWIVCLLLVFYHTNS